MRAFLFVLLVGCSGGGVTSLDECRAECEHFEMCGVPAGSCTCSQSAIDLTNRCADRTGCGAEIGAIHDCVDSVMGCDFAECEDEVLAAGRCVMAWCSTRATDECCSGPAPELAGMGTMAAGEELTFDGVILRSGPRWAATPFLNEVEPGCPLPDFVPALASPAAAVAIEARSDITLDVTMTRDDGESFTARTGLIAVPGNTLPSDIETVRACLDWSTAGGTFPAELMGLTVPAGQSVVLAMWAGPGDAQDVVWHLRVVAR
ncbi:MAG: hypothetical protein H6719_18435 [Sandaracinaceae bacterium]|nr:hypothetical protein [Sandaracinaceae bacterium]